MQPMRYSAANTLVNESPKIRFNIIFNTSTEVKLCNYIALLFPHPGAWNILSKALGTTSLAFKNCCELNFKAFFSSLKLLRISCVLFFLFLGYPVQQSL